MILRAFAFVIFVIAAVLLLAITAVPLNVDLGLVAVALACWVLSTLVAHWTPHLP